MEGRGAEDDADSVSSYSGSYTSSVWTVSSSSSSWRSSSGAVRQGFRFQGDIRVENSSNCYFGNTLHYHGPVTLRVQDAKVIDGLPLARRPRRRPWSAGVAATLKSFLRLPRSLFLFGLLFIALVGVFTCLLVAYFRGYFDPEVPANVTLVLRGQWGAENETRPSAKLADPVDLVLVHDSDSPTSCFNVTACSAQLVEMQRLHFGNGAYDIAYNFLVGGDGRVYEGRGWGKAGAHCLHWNNKSLGVALVGSFAHQPPADAQLDALASFLQWAVQQGRLRRRYKVAGKCQLKKGPSPGPWVMARLKQSPHWWPHTEGDYGCA